MKTTANEVKSAANEVKSTEHGKGNEIRGK